MKKKSIVLIAILAVLVLVVGLAGCSLIGSTTDQIANTVNGDAQTTTVTTYSNMSKDDLEAALTKYREIAETLSERMTDLEELVRQSVSSSQTDIGAYAVTMVDSMLNLTCMESSYNVGCQGTGFIITEDGYVITNNHVVYYETTISETVQNGWFITQRQVPISGEYSSITGVFDKQSKYYNNETTYHLELIYRDASCDLALCKLVESPIVGDAWSAIPFYDGTVLRGDQVLVLGNARGQGLSATQGIVSMTGKTFSDYPNLTFIQTDAAINGGNSGGPAINIYGGLIGVVNSKFVSVIKQSYFASEIEDVEGMGFAIELDKVKAFIAAAQTNKSITVTYKTISAPADDATEQAAA